MSVLQVEREKEKVLREELISELKEKVLKITFTKLNGDVREMFATLRVDLLPIVTLDEFEIKRKKAQSDEVINVWDLKKDNWRCFRVDSILYVDPVDQEY